VIEKARSMTNWADFFYAFVKGPGWFPGTGRLGDITFVAENPVREKYDNKVHPLLHIYTFSHFLLTFLVVDFVVQTAESSAMMLPILLTLYALYGLTNIGLLYEASSWAWPSELVRCGLSLALLKRLSVVFPLPILVLQAVFGGSLLLSSVFTAQSVTANKLFKED